MQRCSFSFNSVLSLLWGQLCKYLQDRSYPKESNAHPVRRWGEGGGEGEGREGGGIESGGGRVGGRERREEGGGGTTSLQT